MLEKKVINSRISQFFNQRQFYLIYPVIFLIGVLTTTLFNSTSYSNLIKSSTFNRLLNQIFAYKGSYFFNASLVLIYLTTCYKIGHGFTKITVQFAVKYIINYLLLHALFIIVDNLFIYTGGSCELTSEQLKILSSSTLFAKSCVSLGGDWIDTVTDSFCSISKLRVHDAEVCRGIKGHWVGGFDISGHFLYLVNNCLLLLNEVRVLNYVEVDLENQKTGRDWLTQRDYIFYCNLICLFVVVVWTYLVCITSIFFHSVTEKGLGLVMGYVSSLVIYHVLQKHIA
ncbi:hypothetical protein WICPIJ_006773 [Wickerhamomyces pijperi]|uniref:Uncharacterized protein n=1 Tax=Wickerhamomyces pijperi TaxID=599730 RepID=A0A9P8TJX1_WICPI|nr:hypothetical protein WICPIJ_006773 [Wickerhamomyces pijperi]